MVAILEAVKSKQFDAVVAYKLDRIVRKTWEALEIAELLPKHKVQLRCVNEKIDTGSEQGKLFYTLLSAMAEWERAIIAECTKAALAQKRSMVKGVPTTHLLEASSPQTVGSSPMNLNWR